jgi:ribonuclease G
MSEEILINSTPNETRVAFVENGILQEVMIERNRKSSIVGNVYLGRVEKILPGLQAAFVDIGTGKSAFMHVSDISAQKKIVRLEGEHEDDEKQNKLQSISSLIHEGQQIVVQIYKDAISTKGARVTTQLSIPSRFLVLLPKEPNIRNLSIRITDEEERNRLSNIINKITESFPQHGFIARTNAEGCDEKDLLRDLEFLIKLWGKVSERIKNKLKGEPLYYEFDLPVKTIRDFISDDVHHIRTDSYQIHMKLDRFIKEFVPQWQGELSYYKGARPIFDFHNIDDEIGHALKKFAPLKSGGNLVIDQNEALTTIDVNTGKYIGIKNQDDTIFKTNLEAAQMIARQIRLRNIGGIIIADFIDMNIEEHKKQVLATLEKHINKDPTRTYIHGITQLGLVEITRKRTTENLQQMLTESCSHCNGLARIKTVESVCYELYREIIRAVRQFQTGQIMVIASNSLIDFIYEEQTQSLAELEEELGKRITLQAESAYSQEQFDVVLM